jgi:outer membrane lipoprotein-sorting protein
MRSLITSLLFAVAAITARAATDPSEILAKVDELRNPLQSFTIDVELTSFVKDQGTVSRFKVYGKGTDRSLVEFQFPKSERGKYLLMTRDAMWMFMPETTRPIRISPLQRLAGQASNGDVARTNFTVDYTPKSAVEEELDGHRTYVLELGAKDAGVAYDRVRLWVDRATYQPIRADFYVVSGKLIKRAFYREFSEVNGRRILTRIEIDDLLRPGHRTVMTYANLAQKDNPEKMFNKDSLGRW